ncbi:MAG: hypothetical protein JNK04_18360, partial [Myxococcales bacterium]|nr:hypothetical protein [Myxococcales bacterium]
MLHAADVHATAGSSPNERIFRGALPDADVSLRARPNGIEDFTQYAHRPAREAAAYEVDLEGVAGLRLVDDVLEILDDAGVPRIRMNRPWIQGADGAAHRVPISVDGCVVDRSPRLPWGRKPTPPGASRCRIDLSWQGLGIGYPALLDPAWVSTGELSQARSDAAMCRTMEGRAIIAGGLHELLGVLTSAEVFDPDTRTWAVIAPMQKPRYDARCELLTDGRTLFVAGIGQFGVLSDAEVYDPVGGVWSNSFLLQSRQEFTLTRLPDGRALVAGGLENIDAPPEVRAELFDPLTNQWSPAGPMSNPRIFHAAFVLPDDRVMVVGGLANGIVQASTEIFDPSTSAWTAGPAMSVPREGVQVGRMGAQWLAIGGHDGNDFLLSTEAFDPATGQWTPRASLPVALQGHAAAPLPSGRAMTLGGELFNGFAGTYVYDPDEDVWLDFGESISRDAAAFTDLADGSVLVAGGRGVNAKLLSSNILFREGELGTACDVDATCGSSHCSDGVCCDSGCGGTCEACNGSGI